MSLYNMPRKKNNNNRRKKKSVVPKSLSLGPYMPERCLARHKYKEVISLSQSYAAADMDTNARNIYRCNGMYDPNETGGGHQPRFFDEMATFYNRYRVVGSKISVKYINLSNEPAYIVLHRGTTGLGTGWTAQQAGELKGTQVRILHALGSGPKSVQTMTSGFSPKKALDKPNVLVYADETLDAPVGEVPEQQWHWTAGMHQVSSTLGAQANLNVQIEVSIDYTAEWFDRKTQSASS